ncbi:chaperonin 10-like protein [Xylogone sp. PMI_703]|nr:chaperonin 10-like protein [Xylogone sp. PMI_703]
MPPTITIPSTGAAATLTGPYGAPYRILQKSVSPLGPDEALIALSFSGVCHGDVYSRDGGGPAPAQPNRPLIGGHEGVGNIIALGENASKAAAGSFKVGDLVGIAWRTAVCGQCEACMMGRENHCEGQVITGMHVEGTYQRYISFPINQLIPIPSTIDIPQACSVLCAGVTAFSALRLMDPKPGQWCVIAGAAGALGHLGIQYAKTFGLKVVAIDGGQPEKEAFCKEMGADAYVDFQKEGEGLAKRVKEVTEGGAHLVLVLSPHQSSYNDAGEYARFGGQIMAIGIGNCSFPLRPILKKHLTVKSNQTGTKEDIIEALKLSVSGQVKCNVEVMKLEQLNEALDRLKGGKVMGKLVVDLKE